MKIFPAIDILGGRVVRLRRGDYAQSTIYEEDPVRVAEHFRSLGARHLHVVDLDGAKEGSTVNFASIRRLAALKDLFIEVGGGIRDESRVEAYLSMGVGRVILGTIAVRDPAFTRRMAQTYGEKIVVGVDAKEGRVAISGWLDVTDIDAVDFCRTLQSEGVKTVIATDIARDGMLSGTNMDLYRQLVGIPGLSVVASGGISSLPELAELREIGVSAAILGKAIYDGKLSLSDALTYEEDTTC